MKKRVILIALPLVAGSILALIFLSWWNPKIINPISKEELGMIYLSKLHRGEIPADVERKMPINLEECRRGDKRYTIHGMGYEASVVLMDLGSKCIIKEYLEIEGYESVYLCSMRKSAKEYNIYTSGVFDIFNLGYCKELPTIFEKF